VPANIWECPNLVQLGDRWVLLLSQWRHVDGTHDLAGVRYLVGTLIEIEDGLRFVAESGGSVDDGPTFYAPQVLVDDDRVLLWGWAWEGAQRTPEEVTAAGWAGVLTFPRELSLGPAGLISRPAVELFELRTTELDPAEPIRESAFEVVAEGPLDLALVDPETGTREVAAQTTGAARVLVDGSIVEVFGDGPPATSRHYPTAGAHWEVSAPDGARVWRLG